MITLIVLGFIFILLIGHSFDESIYNERVRNNYYQHKDNKNDSKQRNSKKSGK